MFDAHAAAVGGLQTVCAVMDVPDAGLKQASGGGGGGRWGGGVGEDDNTVSNALTEDM